MEVTFWGVRGSIPCSGPDYRRVGGHTSCVSASFDNTLVIFDAGTGMRDLGLWLKNEKPHIKTIHLFLSHAHYDHIIGFPFFGPIWDPSVHLNIYATIMGPMGGIHHFFQHHLFQPPFFPVQLSQLQATFTFHDISDGDHLTILPHVGVDVFPLNHPGGASGFRLQVNKKVMCYVSDTEHEPTKGPSKTILNAIKDADLIVYDTSFTDEEYVHFQGWGHSTWQEGVRLCLDAGVKRMALYHHDPSHTDTLMDAIELKAQSLFPGAFVARQGMTVIL